MATYPHESRINRAFRSLLQGIWLSKMEMNEEDAWYLKEDKDNEDKDDCDGSINNNNSIYEFPTIAFSPFEIPMSINGVEWQHSSILAKPQLVRQNAFNSIESDEEFARALQASITNQGRTRPRARQTTQTQTQAEPEPIPEEEQDEDEEEENNDN